MASKPPDEQRGIVSLPSQRDAADGYTWKVLTVNQGRQRVVEQVWLLTPGRCGYFPRAIWSKYHRKRIQDGSLHHFRCQNLQNGARQRLRGVSKRFNVMYSFVFYCQRTNLSVPTTLNRHILVQNGVCDGWVIGHRTFFANWISSRCFVSHKCVRINLNGWLSFGESTIGS